MRRIAIFVAMVATSLAMITAQIGRADDESDCLNSSDNIPRGIAGCDAVIASGRLTGIELSEAHFWRALYHYEIDDYDRALPDFDKALRLNPENSEILYFRGITHRLAGNYPESIDDLSELIRRESDHVGAYNNRARAYQRAGDTSSALEDYDSALERDPGFSNALVGRGDILLAIGDTKRALADYEAALRRMARVGPNRNTLSEWWLADYEGAREGRAEALRMLGRPITAIDDVTGPGPNILLLDVRRLHAKPSDLAACLSGSKLLPGGVRIDSWKQDLHLTGRGGREAWFVQITVDQRGMTTVFAKGKSGKGVADRQQTVAAIRGCER
jgi:tetratricopeptide (TPR) repeat protein